MFVCLVNEHPESLGYGRQSGADFMRSLYQTGFLKMAVLLVFRGIAYAAIGSPGDFKKLDIGVVRPAGERNRASSGWRPRSC